MITRIGLLISVSLISQNSLGSTGSLICLNPATGAAITVPRFSSGGGQFLMNQNLVNNLRDQGPRHVQGSGFGNSNGDLANCRYHSSIAGGYALSLTSLSGGILLTYSGQSSSGHQSTSLFYFNYGECTIR